MTLNIIHRMTAAAMSNNQPSALFRTSNTIIYIPMEWVISGFSTLHWFSGSSCKRPTNWWLYLDQTMKWYIEPHYGPNWYFQFCWIWWCFTISCHLRDSHYQIIYTMARNREAIGNERSHYPKDCHQVGIEGIALQSLINTECITISTTRWTQKRMGMQ